MTVLSAATTSLMVVVWIGWGVCTAVDAQVFVDQQLGAEVSVVTSRDTRDLVSGGAIRGEFLFHSFQRLNVPGGRSLYFMQPDGVAQIFSRVTGGSPSSVNGTLGVLGNADLFLLNPNGILFGPDAQLDMAGSFLASTAQSLQFEGFVFDAITPEPVPLLTVSAPLGLRFGAAGTIVNQSVANGVGLSVQPFQTLALLGGEIDIQGGRLTVPSGQIELASVDDGYVDLAWVSDSSVPDRWAFRYAGVLGRGAIALSDQALVLASQALENPASQTRVVAQNLTLSNRSALISDTSGPFDGAALKLDLANLDLELGSQVLSVTRGLGRGGSIEVEASDSIELRSISPFIPSLGNAISSQASGSGVGGAIAVNARNILLQEGSRIESATWSTGAGGDLKISATDTLLAEGVNPKLPSFPSGITTNTFGAGAGGNVQIEAGSVSLQTGANIVTGVIANRDDLLQLPAYEPFRSALGEPGAGTGIGGNLQLIAGRMVIEGADVRAPDTPSQLGSLTIGSGNTGNVVVSTKELEIKSGGLLLSSAVPSVVSLGNPLPNAGTGNVGQLYVQAETIEVKGSNPFFPLASTLGTQTLGAGNAGQTLIETDQLRVLDGGSVSSGTFTSGNAGALTIKATEAIEVSGVNANGLPASIGTSAEIPSGMLAEKLFIMEPVPSGDTGDLVIESERLRIADGGVIGVRHQGTGDAGDMRITANRLLLMSGAQLSAETKVGTGGNIGLTIRDNLLLRGGSTITAEALGARGDGGNIRLDAGVIVAIPDENSDIIANARGGDGGNITLRTGRLIGLQFQRQLTGQSDITASSEIGVNGTVNIDLFAADPNQGLIDLPLAILNSDAQISTDCRRTQGSRFIASGRGGLPTDPRQHLPSQRPLEDWRSDQASGFFPASALGNHPSERDQHQQISASGNLQVRRRNLVPVEAQELRINANNDVVLIAGLMSPVRLVPRSQAVCPSRSSH